MLTLDSRIAEFWPATPSQGSAAALLQFLEEQGTFQFPRLPTGLFSASTSSGSDFQVTGYHNVWVRDTVHIAHMHLVIGQADVAVGAMRALLKFYEQSAERIAALIAGTIDRNDVMLRPHIRFDGTHLRELDEKWSHAQNDALGAFVWLTSRLLLQGAFTATQLEQRTLHSIVEVLGAVEFWADEDSGHWEEVRKIAASSIGVATAGLREYRQLLTSAGESFGPIDVAATLPRLDAWLMHADTALAQILPHECRQDDPHKRRAYDAALLFLIEPYGLFPADTPLARELVHRTCDNLLGLYGIRRYLGDSYWCANYKQALSADQRTADFSDDLSVRDALFTPGSEAQWCLFDPLLSIIHARAYAATGSASDRAAQLGHLERSLTQLTRTSDPSGPYRCPESYYCENGRYVPNDICPLLWTQANLRMALHWLAKTSP